MIIFPQHCVFFLRVSGSDFYLQAGELLNILQKCPAAAVFRVLEIMLVSEVVFAD